MLLLGHGIGVDLMCECEIMFVIYLSDEIAMELLVTKVRDC